MNRLALKAWSLAMGVSVCAAAQSVEQWGVFEASFSGPSSGNPYTDVTLTARFSRGSRSFTVDGFYDGNGTYKVRCMPDEPGEWTYTTTSNRSELNGRSGSFVCTPPVTPGNHGPVRVVDGLYLGYADGTPFHCFGTTMYCWLERSDYWENLTLQELAKNLSPSGLPPFNKVRFLLLPAHGGDFVLMNGSVPNPSAWQHLEQRIGDLAAIGIEADLILFHPYAGGSGNLPTETATLYLTYAAARLAAFRNVWWCVSNEHVWLGLPDSEWDRRFQLLMAKDPYGHLRSLHNGNPGGDEVYYNSRSWVTHMSLQAYFVAYDTYRTYFQRFRKPIVLDEFGYEGNTQIAGASPQYETKGFWDAAIAGAYATHGDGYEVAGTNEGKPFFGDGGVFSPLGQSPARIAFMRKIIEASYPYGLYFTNSDQYSARKGDGYYLYYFGEQAPSSWSFSLPAGKTYRVDVIDTWNMTIESRGSRSGSFTLPLPGRQYIAVRLYLETPPVSVASAGSAGVRYQSVLKPSAMAGAWDLTGRRTRMSAPGSAEGLRVVADGARGSVSVVVMTRDAR